MSGQLVTFEGPEGSGKSTACRKMIEMFEGTQILLVREPGSTPLGEKIRSILQTEDMPDRAELMLFEAARSCIVDQVIMPALAGGTNVICDRFYDSTTAYQGYGRGLPHKDISALNEMAVHGLAPTLTVVFDIDPAIGMARKGKATDRIEAAGAEFHVRVRNGFLEMARNNRDRFAVIDASRPREEVIETVAMLLERRLGWRRKNGAAPAGGSRMVSEWPDSCGCDLRYNSIVLGFERCLARELLGELQAIVAKWDKQKQEDKAS